MTLKIAVLAPMPSPSVRIANNANVRFFRSVRIAKRMFCPSWSIGGLFVDSLQEDGPSVTSKSLQEPAIAVSPPAGPVRIRNRSARYRAASATAASRMARSRAEMPGSAGGNRPVRE